MRKLTPLLVVAVILAMAAPASAKRVVNESYTQYEIDAFLGHEENESMAFAFMGDQGANMSLWYNDGFDCEGQPDEAVAGVDIQVHWVYDMAFEIAPLKGKDKFTHGFASGVIGDGYMHVNFCGMEPEDIFLGGHVLTIYMDGTDGPLAKSRNSNSFHVPGDTNNHQNTRSTMRLGTGEVDISDVWSWSGVPGWNGKTTWSSHINE